MLKYLIQLIESPVLPNIRFPHPDIIPFVEQFEYKQFLSGTSEDRLIPVSLEELTPELCRDSVPLGTVEFTNRVLELLEHSPLKPTNIPEQLNHPVFLRRRVATGLTKEKLPELFLAWNCNDIFVKSASRIKDDCTDIYNATAVNALPGGPDNLYFASEKVYFGAEFRAFVWQGQVIDCKPYLGKATEVPTGLVRESARAIGVGINEPLKLL